MEDIKSVNELFETCKDVNKGFIFAICTDKILCDSWPLAGTENSDYDENLVLEIRIFDEEKEYKLFRGNMGKEFKYRLMDDADDESNKDTGILDYYDEIQYLDIATTNKPKQDKDGLTKVRATGGGEYYLPIKADIKDLEYAVLKVRYYISKYTDSGKAYVSDWRCVGLYKSDAEAEKCVKSLEGGE